MLPYLVCATLAIGRTTWHPVVRIALAVVAATNAVVLLPPLLNELSWPRAVVGWLAMLVLYAVIVIGLSHNLRPVRTS